MRSIALLSITGEPLESVRTAFPDAELLHPTIEDLENAMRTTWNTTCTEVRQGGGLWLAIEYLQRSLTMQALAAH